MTTNERAQQRNLPLCTAEELRTAADVMLNGEACGMCTALMIARRHLRRAHGEPGQWQTPGSWSLQATHEQLGFRWDVGLGGYLQNFPSPSSREGRDARVARLRQLADMIDAPQAAASQATATPNAKEQHE